MGSQSGEAGAGTPGTEQGKDTQQGDEQQKPEESGQSSDSGDTGQQKKGKSG